MFFRRSMPSGEISAIGRLAAHDARAAQSFEQLVPLLDDADLLLAVQLELCVQPLERRQVDADLLGQLAGVAVGERPHRAVMLIEVRFGLGELLAEEVGGPDGFLRAHLLVLLHVERGDRVGDVSDLLAGIARVAEGERDTSWCGR